MNQWITLLDPELIEAARDLGIDPFDYPRLDDFAHDLAAVAEDAGDYFAELTVRARALSRPPKRADRSSLPFRTND